MQESITSQLVCRHGTTLASCPVCQSALPHAHKELNAKLDELLATARPRLLRIAQLNGIGQDGVEDVVQETLIEAWRHLAKLREPERFAAWLDGICRNVCKRHIRAQANVLPTSTLTSNEDEATANEVDLPDPLAIDPSEELERQDMQILLDRALGHLSASTRELIELHYLAELPQREVAQRLDMSLGALELKLHRARRQLRQILNGELRADAQAFGILLDVDEAMGWQDTRQWCWLCGKQRMRGTFEHQPSGVIALRLRCPDCSSRYDVDITHTGDWPVFDNVHSFRPAIKRVAIAASAYYGAVLNEQRCNICQSTVQVQIIDRSISSVSGDAYDSLPHGFYLRVDCPICGTLLSEFISALLTSVTVRNFFHDHPRLLSEPNIPATYAGQNAIRSRLVDLSTNETLTIMTHPETLEVMTTIPK